MAWDSPSLAPTHSGTQELEFNELRQNSRRSLNVGQMFRTKACPGRRVRFIQLYAGDHTTTAAEEIKRDGNHGARLDLQRRIEQFAMTRIFPDLVFKERLFAGKNHANDARVQGLLEFSHQLVGVGAGIPGRDEKFANLIQEPDGAFIGAGFSEPAFNRLTHEWIEQRAELLRLNARGNPFEPLREDGLQLRKGWLRKDI